MKTKTGFFLFAAVVILFCGCEKHCKNVKLSALNGGSGFSELSDATVYEGRAVLSKAYQHGDFLITDSIGYDTLFNTKKIFGEINFNERMLIGINRGTNPNSGMDYHAGVFVKNNSSVLKLKVDYSLKDQCNGSGIGSYSFEIWANVPKSMVNYQIIYEVNDINPF